MFLLLIHAANPGTDEIMSITPYAMETAMMASLDAPLIENSPTIAPSLTPHPAKGTLVDKPS